MIFILKLSSIPGLDSVTAPASRTTAAPAATSDATSSVTSGAPPAPPAPGAPPPPVSPNLSLGTSISCVGHSRGPWNSYFLFTSTKKVQNLRYHLAVYIRLHKNYVLENALTEIKCFSGSNQTEYCTCC